MLGNWVRTMSRPRSARLNKVGSLTNVHPNGYDPRCLKRECSAEAPLSAPSKSPGCLLLPPSENSDSQHWALAGTFDGARATYRSMHAVHTGSAQRSNRICRPQCLFVSSEMIGQHGRLVSHANSLTRLINALFLQIVLGTQFHLRSLQLYIKG
jgi:hypothetical protein